MAIKEMLCSFCGKKFVGTSRAKFCSSKCRVNSFNMKKRGKIDYSK